MSDKILVALQAFTGVVDGERVRISAGDLIHAGHPVVKGREHLFGEPKVLDYERPKQEPRRKVAPKTEQATAAPGEVRELSNEPAVSDE